MNVLVTGGAGFIGSHVADILLEAGHNVVIVDNLHSGHRRNVPEGAKFYEADITDGEAMEQIFADEGINAVSHQAALAKVRESMFEPLEYARVNLLGSLTLVELARKYDIKKFVFASSGGAAYGEGFGKDSGKLPFTEKSWPEPRDNYGANKLSFEHHLILYYHAYGLKYNCLRYPNVYGPRQDSKGEAGVVSIFADAMLNDEPTHITGDGKQLRDFCYVRDIARANLLTLTSDNVGVYNFGTGIPTDINTLHGILSELTGYSQTPSYVKQPLGEVRASYLDSTKAMEELGWTPEVTLIDGLQAVVDWMRTTS